MAWGRGDIERAARYHHASLVLRRELGDVEGISQSLHNLGNLAIERGDLSEADAYHHEALTLRRQLGNTRDVALSLGNLGRLAMMQGDLTTAREMMEESLALAHEVGGHLTVASPTRDLGDLALLQGDVDGAADRYAECLRLACDVGAQMTIARGIETAALVAHPRGQLESATQLLGAAEAIREAIRSPQVPTERAPCEPAIAAARARLGEAGFARAWAAGRGMSTAAAIEAAFAVLRGSPAGAVAMTNTPPGRLSPREIEVVELIAHGLTNRQIAERLVISERTAHAHVRNILDKLGCSSRTEVATWAVQHGVAGLESLV
jgi:DNA-binding CsgD family transcriptional regulator/tetratricopeptide (TPR) repeat protein